MTTEPPPAQPLNNKASDAEADVSIVVPTYREADNIRQLVGRISRALEPTGRGYEIIIVDDDSQDGTEQIVSQLQAEGAPVRLEVRRNQRGLSSAVVYGFDQARGDLLVCMDADLSHPPEALPALLECLDKDPQADFVIGSRYVPGGSTEQGWGLFRWLNSKVATLLARPFTSAKDPMAGFFALRRDTLRRAEHIDPIGYKIGLELIVKCRCRNIREVPIHFADRKLGQSKLNLRQQLDYLRHIKRLADVKYGGYSQLAQFCLVGATGIVVNLVVFKLLMWAGLIDLIASAIAIWLSMTTNFYLNRRLTFSYSRKHSPWGQYPKFLASCSLGGIINWAIFATLTTYVTPFDRYKLSAQFVGIVAGTFLNFLLSRTWVFGRITHPLTQTDRTQVP